MYLKCFVKKNVLIREILCCACVGLTRPSGSRLTAISLGIQCVHQNLYAVVQHKQVNEPLNCECCLLFKISGLLDIWISSSCCPQLLFIYLLSFFLFLKSL